MNYTTIKRLLWGKGRGERGGGREEKKRGERGCEYLPPQNIKGFKLFLERGKKKKEGGRKKKKKGGVGRGERTLNANPQLAGLPGTTKTLPPLEEKKREEEKEERKREGGLRVVQGKTASLGDSI